MINNILVIEDEKFIGEMYVRSLKIAGYSVDWAVDGNDGLVMLNNKKYDLQNGKRNENKFFRR